MKIRRIVCAAAPVTRFVQVRILNALRRESGGEFMAAVLVDRHAAVEPFSPPAVAVP